MTFYISSSLTPTHFSKPLNPSNTLFPIQFRGSLSSFVRRRKPPTEAKLSSKFNLFPSRRNGLVTCCSKPSFESTESSVSQEEDAESNRLFEKLRETERERLSNMEELERKANVQLERQLVMASD